MSKPHIVVVRVDFAPWDSDIEFEARVIGFDDRETAWKYHTEVVKIAHEYDPDIIIQALEPEPIVEYGSDAVMALAHTIDWLAEADPA